MRRWRRSCAWTATRWAEAHAGWLGPHAHQLRALDLGRNAFRGLPGVLGRAAGCRHLTIMLLGGLGAADTPAESGLARSPLLSMPALRTLLEQASWAHEDVAALAALQRVHQLWGCVSP